MNEWLREVFEIVTPKYGKLIEPEQVAFEHDGKTVMIPLELLASVFESVTVPPSATDLKAVDPGDERGWHAYIDSWVEQGILAEGGE